MRSSSEGGAAAAAGPGEAGPGGARGGQQRPSKSKFQKTKLCSFFLAGRCKKRGRCLFAHSEADLRSPPDLRCTKMCPMVMDGMECDQDECMFAHTQEELRPADPAGGALEPAEHREPRGELESERPGEEAVGGGGPVAADDEDDDDFCLESPADGFKRGQTEDPLALCVRVMRVKNTFITIDEEEEEDPEDKDVDRQHRRPLRSRSAPALSRQRSEAPRPPRRPEQAAATQSSDKGRGPAASPGPQPSASLPGPQPAAGPHLPPAPLPAAAEPQPAPRPPRPPPKTMGPCQQAKAPSLRAPRPASPQCPGPGAATWPRYAGEGRADLPQESASALGALRFGHGAAAARGPAAPWGDGGPCWWQKGHGAQREESGGAPMGGGRLHQRRQRGTPPFGGSGGSGGQSGSGGYSDSGSGSSAGSGDGLPYRFAGGGAIGGPPSGKLGEPVFIQPSWGGLLPGGQPAPGLEMRQAWTGRSAFSTGRRPMYTVAPAPSLSLLRCLGEQGGSGR